MWTEVRRHRQNMYFFCYKSASNGTIPLSNFTKFGMGEGVPGKQYHAKSHRCGFQNVVLHSPKNREKMLFFGINLPLRENYGVHRKTTNLHAMAP